MEGGILKVYLAAYNSETCSEITAQIYMKPEVPTAKDWVDVIHKSFVKERLTFTLRLQRERFDWMWGKWLEYITTPLRPDFV